MAAYLNYNHLADNPAEHSAGAAISSNLGNQLGTRLDPTGEAYKMSWHPLGAIWSALHLVTYLGILHRLRINF